MKPYGIRIPSWADYRAALTGVARTGSGRDCCRMIDAFDGVNRPQRAFDFETVTETARGDRAAR